MKKGGSVTHTGKRPAASPYTIFGLGAKPHGLLGFWAGLFLKSLPTAHLLGPLALVASFRHFLARVVRGVRKSWPTISDICPATASNLGSLVSTIDL
jgi:hypothetical protein